MPTKQTISIAVTFTLDSSAGAPPFNVSSCSGQITYDSGPPQPFSGWNAVDVGTPDPNGAVFSLNVIDANYPSGQTSVANWALTFIPRPGTSQASPFGNNQNTVAGTGSAAAINGNFSLPLGTVRVKNAGDWDWALMIQISFPNSTIKCFASDPEMDVDA